MKKFVYKLIRILPILLLGAFVLSSGTALATIPDIEDVSDPTGGKIGKILGIIQFIGISVALAMLIIIGIQYVAAPAEKKGQIKDDALGYIIGAFCIFGAVAILQLIKTMVTNVTS